MAGGVRPGFDPQAVAASVPKIRADLEFTDSLILKGSVLVFSTLIDEQPDEKGHMSRLSITQQERDSIVREIDLSFGEAIQKPPNDAVAAANVIRSYLTKKGYAPR